MLLLALRPVRTFYFLPHRCSELLQEPGRFAPGDNTIFRRSRMASVPLKHDDSVLIIIVVIKPAGSDDSVDMPTGSDQAFRASLPVMNFSTLIPATEPLSYANRCHQGDANRCIHEYSQNVTYTAVIYCSGANTSLTIRAECKNDGINIFR